MRVSFTISSTVWSLISYSCSLSFSEFSCSCTIIEVKVVAVLAHFIRIKDSYPYMWHTPPALLPACFFVSPWDIIKCLALHKAVSCYISISLPGWCWIRLFPLLLPSDFWGVCLSLGLSILAIPSLSRPVLMPNFENTSIHPSGTCNTSSIFTAPITKSFVYCISISTSVRRVDYGMLFLHSLDCCNHHSCTSFHQLHVSEIVPSQCLAQPMAIPLAVVRSWVGLKHAAGSVHHGADQKMLHGLPDATVTHFWFV